MEALERQQVFKDPLYGFIHIDHTLIKQLIDTPAFQRLRRIRQLSGVHMVFHGAEHSRFSHSLGVYEVANRFLTVPDLKKALGPRGALVFLSAALLHDIGHGAYSHAFEDVFGLNHEHVGAKIIMQDPTIRTLLDGVDATFAQDVASILTKEGKFKLVEQLISSQLDVDRLDYLERDAYFTGAAYGHIDLDRLIRVLRIVDGQAVFKISGIHAIENYLISRYHMYWQVYYHPVSRAYEAILEKIYRRVKVLIDQKVTLPGNISALKRIMDDPDDIETYLKIDDYYINGLIIGFLECDDRILSTLAQDFINRRLWKYINDDAAHQKAIEDIKKTYDKEDLAYFTSHRTVFNNTYKEVQGEFGDQIYILLDDGTLSTLHQESPIISSLMQSGAKRDPKFFYRKP